MNILYILFLTVGFRFLRPGAQFGAALLHNLGLALLRKQWLSCEKVNQLKP